MPRLHVLNCQPKLEAAAAFPSVGSSPVTGETISRHGCHGIGPRSQSSPCHQPLSPIWVLKACAPETIFRSITEESGAMLDDCQESLAVGPKCQPPACRPSCAAGWGVVTIPLTSLAVSPTKLTILDAPDQPRRAAHFASPLEPLTSTGRQLVGGEE